MKMIKHKNVDTVREKERELHFNKIKNEIGITLVALIVTIVILLILAGISIAQLTGSELFEKAKLAKEKQENARIKEETKLGDYENKIGQYVDGNRDTVTISKEEYERYKNSSSYSTTEKEVGTWIDGSKLYKVTINHEMYMNGANWYAFDLELSKYNIKKLIETNYYGEEGGTYNYLMSYITGDVLKIYLSTNDVIAPNCVTLTYTKNE